jgi:hypothetical protein
MYPMLNLYYMSDIFTIVHLNTYDWVKCPYKQRFLFISAPLNPLAVLISD